MADYKDNRMGFHIPQPPPENQLKGKTPEELLAEWDKYARNIAAHMFAVRTIDSYAGNPGMRLHIDAMHRDFPENLHVPALRQYHVTAAKQASEDFVAFIKKHVKPEYPEYQSFLDVPKRLQAFLNFQP
ncbi:MAG: hypothetical protein MJE68_10580 [Proteobacteria bacterium]|nr:hypothetical protein [Pseudomonadota bacterium]